MRTEGSDFKTHKDVLELYLKRTGHRCISAEDAMGVLRSMALPLNLRRC